MLIIMPNSNWLDEFTARRSWLEKLGSGALLWLIAVVTAGLILLIPVSIGLSKPAQAQTSACLGGVNFTVGEEDKVVLPTNGTAAYRIVVRCASQSTGSNPIRSKWKIIDRNPSPVVCNGVTYQPNTEYDWYSLTPDANSQIWMAKDDAMPDCFMGRTIRITLTLWREAVDFQKSVTVTGAANAPAAPSFSSTNPWPFHCAGGAKLTKSTIGSDPLGDLHVQLYELSSLNTLGDITNCFADLLDMRASEGVTVPSNFSDVATLIANAYGTNWSTTAFVQRTRVLVGSGSSVTLGTVGGWTFTCFLVTSGSQAATECRGQSGNKYIRVQTPLVTA